MTTESKPPRGSDALDELQSKGVSMHSLSKRLATGTLAGEKWTRFNVAKTDCGNALSPDIIAAPRGRCPSCPRIDLSRIGIETLATERTA